jgi:hypothetical protein
MYFVFATNQARTHFGRPNWKQVFSNLATTQKDKTIGKKYILSCNSLLISTIVSHQLILELDLIRLHIMCPSNLYNNFVALRSSRVILSMGHVQGSSTVDQQLLGRNLTYYQKRSHKSHPQSLISTRRTSEYKNPCTIINIDMKLQQNSSKR